MVQKSNLFAGCTETINRTYNSSLTRLAERVDQIYVPIPPNLTDFFGRNTAEVELNIFVKIKPGILQAPIECVETGAQAENLRRGTSCLKSVSIMIWA